MHTTIAMNTTSSAFANTTSDSLTKESSDAPTYGMITETVETMHTTSPRLLTTNLVTQRATATSSTKMKTTDSLDRKTTETSTIGNDMRKYISINSYILYFTVEN